MNTSDVVKAIPLVLPTWQDKKKSVDDAIVRIAAGEVLSVADASGSLLGLCIGDFREIGWSERCTDRGGLWYHWSGPTAIRVGGQLIQPNTSTEKVDMDWS